MLGVVRTRARQCPQSRKALDSIQIVRWERPGLHRLGFRRWHDCHAVVWRHIFIFRERFGRGDMGVCCRDIGHVGRAKPHDSNAQSGICHTDRDIPWFAGLMILGVFVVGMLAALLAVSEAARTPIVSTLRSE